MAEDEPISEITVTAVRREAAVQKVPVAVSVVTEDDLRRSGAIDTFGLSQLVPGFTFSTNTVMGQPYIRGVGSKLLSAGSEPSVATYVDGVYQSRPLGSIQTFFDVNRVEVLKGPQGALYGRNATGGAVSIITNRPEHDLAAAGEAAYGKYDERELRGMANLPVVQDKLALRFAGILRKRDGHTDNIYLGTKLGSEDMYAMRGQALWSMGNGIEVLVRAHYGQDEGTHNMFGKLLPPYEDSASVALGATVPSDPRQVTQNLQPSLHAEVWGVNGEVTAPVGDLTLTSLTAFHHSEFAMVIDLDTTNIDFASNHPMEDSDVFSQEWTLSSAPVGPLEWLVGANYFQEDASQAVNLYITPFMLHDEPMGDVRLKSGAAFAQVTYDLAPRWQLIGAARYSYEKRWLDFVQQVNDVPLVAYNVSKSWDSLSPSLSLTYAATSDVMLYGSVRRGYKSGGYNANQAQMEPFDPEVLWSYEGGVKSTLAGGRVRANVDAFYYDYSDLQVSLSSILSISGGTSTIENAAEATVKGLEADVSADPLDGLTLQAGLALLDAKFDQYTTLNPNDPLAGPDQSGNRMPNAPEATWHLAAAYRMAAGSAGSVTLSGDYHHRSSMFFDAYEDPLVKGGDYDLINANLRFDATSGRWYAMLYGRNLTDALYEQNMVRDGGRVGRLAFYADPRTYGVRLGVTY